MVLNNLHKDSNNEFTFSHTKTFQRFKMHCCLSNISNKHALSKIKGGLSNDNEPKQELITQVAALLNAAIEVDNEQPPIQTKHSQQIEMLTIKECAKTVSGLSEHTIRQLVAQNKIPYIRTGQGNRGKILINKSALLEYIGGAA